MHNLQADRERFNKGGAGGRGPKMFPKINLQDNFSPWFVLSTSKKVFGVDYFAQDSKNYDRKSIFQEKLAPILHFYTFLDPFVMKN